MGFHRDPKSRVESIQLPERNRVHSITKITPASAPLGKLMPSVPPRHFYFIRPIPARNRKTPVTAS